jgi:hypothetical protein
VVITLVVEQQVGQKRDGRVGKCRLRSNGAVRYISVAETRRHSWPESLKLSSWEGEWGTYTVREVDIPYFTYRTFIGFMFLAREKQCISCFQKFSTQ